MSDKFYVGLDLTGFQNNSVQRPVSRVTLKVDEELVLTAGDDTGLELTADCPHATQAMVNALLAQVKGTKYQMYEASSINIDPSAELGDGITASRVYSVISRIDDNGSGFPSVSAPGQAELEDEYPAGGPMTQIITRKIAETHSQITKTAEEIRLEVANDLQQMSASITVELGKVTSRVQDVEGNVSSLVQTAAGLQSQITAVNGNVSKIEQKVGSISLSVVNGSTSSSIQLIADGAVISSQNISMSGLVTYTGLSSGTTTIDGACIKTGTIAAERLNLTGKITFSDLNSSAQSLINSANTNASSALAAANTAANTVSQWSYNGTTYIDGTKIMADTIIASKLKGGTVELLGPTGLVAGRIGISGLYTDVTGRLHIQSYMVSVGSVFNPLGTIYFGDFENGNESGRLSIGSNLRLVGKNGNKVCLCYEGSEGAGGTFKTLLTAGYDTLTFDYNGSNTVHCYNNLDMHNYSVLNTSDRRLKANIEESGIDALSVINAMRTYSFDWQEDGRHEKLGFIAQQLEEVNGAFVHINPKDGLYSTKEMKIIPYLVKAVQELSAKLEAMMKGDCHNEQDE